MKRVLKIFLLVCFTMPFWSLGKEIHIYYQVRTKTIATDIKDACGQLNYQTTIQQADTLCELASGLEQSDKSIFVFKQPLEGMVCSDVANTLTKPVVRDLIHSYTLVFYNSDSASNERDALSKKVVVVYDSALFPQRSLVVLRALRNAYCSGGPAKDIGMRLGDAITAWRGGQMTTLVVTVPARDVQDVLCLLLAGSELQFFPRIIPSDSAKANSVMDFLDIENPSFKILPLTDRIIGVAYVQRSIVASQGIMDTIEPNLPWGVTPYNPYHPISDTSIQALVNMMTTPILYLKKPVPNPFTIDTLTGSDTLLAGNVGRFDESLKGYVQVDLKSLCRLEISNKGITPLDSVSITIKLPEGSLIAWLKVASSSGTILARDRLNPQRNELSSTATIKVDELPINGKVNITVWLGRTRQSGSKKTFAVEVGVASPVFASSKLFQIESASYPVYTGIKYSSADLNRTFMKYQNTLLFENNGRVERVEKDSLSNYLRRLNNPKVYFKGNGDTTVILRTPELIDRVKKTNLLQNNRTTIMPNQQ